MFTKTICAENETLYTLVCTVCGEKLQRKRAGNLEKLADSQGWKVSDGTTSTRCGRCIAEGK